MSIKPYCVILVHEDQEESDGVPTEVVAYTWTHMGGEKVKKSSWATQPNGKWMMVLANGWMWWWTMKAGTLYRYDGFDEETSTFKTTPIYWWRRERLWRALWRLIRGKHSGDAHRSTKSED